MIFQLGNSYPKKKSFDAYDAAQASLYLRRLEYGSLPYDATFDKLAFVDLASTSCAEGRGVACPRRLRTSSELAMTQ